MGKSTLKWEKISEIWKGKLRAEIQTLIGCRKIIDLVHHNKYLLAEVEFIACISLLLRLTKNLNEISSMCNTWFTVSLYLQNVSVIFNTPKTPPFRTSFGTSKGEWKSHFLGSWKWIWPQEVIHIYTHHNLVLFLTCYFFHFQSNLVTCGSNFLNKYITIHVYNLTNV